MPSRNLRKKMQHSSPFAVYCLLFLVICDFCQAETPGTSEHDPLVAQKRRRHLRLVTSSRPPKEEFDEQKIILGEESASEFGEEHDDQSNYYWSRLLEDENSMNNQSPTSSPTNLQSSSPSVSGQTCIDPDNCSNSLCDPVTNICCNECCQNPVDGSLGDACLIDTDCCGDDSFCDNFDNDGISTGLPGLCCNGGGGGCNYSNGFPPTCEDDSNYIVKFKRSRGDAPVVLQCNDVRLRNTPALCVDTDLIRRIPIFQVCQNLCNYCEDDCQYCE